MEPWLPGVSLALVLTLLASGPWHPDPPREHYIPLEMVQSTLSVEVVEAPPHLQPDDPTTYLVVEGTIRNKTAYRLWSWLTWIDVLGPDGDAVASFRAEGRETDPGEEVPFSHRVSFGHVSTEQVECGDVSGEGGCDVILSSAYWTWAEQVPAAIDAPDGPITPTLVELALGSNTCIEQCFADYMEAGGEHVGKLWLKSTVRPSGEITAVHFTNPADDNQLLEPCVQLCVSRFWFEPHAGSAKCVKYPFIIRPRPAR